MTIIYVREEGVLARVIRENSLGVFAQWFIDGLRFETFLTHDEFIWVDENFEGDEDD
jgi:hypothetical protein